MSATYPRRWLAAILFASIVALTAGSFTDVWAASNGGTPPTVPKLTTVELDVDEITVSSGATRTFVATAKDEIGDAFSGGVTFEFSVIDSNGTIVPSTGVFTASTGPATTSVRVLATQGSLTAEDTAIVTINSPPPVPVPTAAPVNPSVEIPPPPPPSVVGAEVETITPVEGGTVTLETTGTADEPARQITIEVPSSAVDDFVALDVAPVAAASVPPVPAALRIRVSGTVVDLTFTDIDGNPIDNFVANRAVKITISYTTADADDAGGAQNLVIMKYDEVTGDWVALPTTVNLAGMTISASVKTFSLFGVGIPEVSEPASPSATATPRPPAEATLPATGDVAPGNNAVIAFTVIGLLLMTGGIALIRRRFVSVAPRNRS